MEYKIGEIFEYNGEWYQCLKSSSHRCGNCDFGKLHKCYKIACINGERKDGKNVHFKKLEKVGEPIIYMNRTFQRLKSIDDNICKHCYFSNQVCNPQLCGEVFFLVEIKKVAKDMGEENDVKTLYSEGTVSNTDNLLKSNLKPFDLEAAKTGKPICTRDGRKARIVCFDRKANTPIIALIECDNRGEILQCVHNDGRCCQFGISDNDLMMSLEKKEGWVNVYKNQIHNTLESAEECRKRTTDYIKTIRVEWEE